jgi:hypothetical protein
MKVFYTGAALAAFDEWADDHAGVVAAPACLLTLILSCLFVMWARHAHPMICGALLGFGAGRVRVRHLAGTGASSMLLLFLIIGVAGGLVSEWPA